MKEKFIAAVLQRMMGRIENEDLLQLRQTLIEELEGKDIVAASEKDNSKSNAHFIETFISSKRLEGCSDKTLVYYQNTLRHMLSKIKKGIKDISTDDLRNYLADYHSENGVSRVTIDNVRRIISTFFSWLEDEDHILKSPARRIHKVKTSSVVKDTFSDEEIERMRDACKTERDLAIVDMFSSTGMRVGEMASLKRSDVNLDERECLVTGKGNKQRSVYFDARTKIHLERYLNGRTDDCESLFVSFKNPGRGIGIGGIECLIRRLGKKAGISHPHPHKFRRTVATVAIDKGMPIEQVQRLLGHERIDTTLMYAMVKQANVKASHRRYLG